MKDSQNMSRLHRNVIVDTTPKHSKIFEHYEHTLELANEKIDTKAPRRSKR
jgi:hypothetical protein